MFDINLLIFVSYFSTHIYLFSSSQIPQVNEKDTEFYTVIDENRENVLPNFYPQQPDVSIQIHYTIQYGNMISSRKTNFRYLQGLKATEMSKNFFVSRLLIAGWKGLNKNRTDVPSVVEEFHVQGHLSHCECHGRPVSGASVSMFLLEHRVLER